MVNIIIEDANDNKIEANLISTIEMNKIYKNGISLRYCGNVMDFTDGAKGVYMKFLDNGNSIYLVEIK